MRRAICRFLLGLAVAGVWACAGVDDSVNLSDRADASILALDGGVSRVLQSCPTAAQIRMPTRTLDVLILLDRSASMDLMFGIETRYRVVAAALSQLVETNAAHVSFGLQEMPGRQNCGAYANKACCASPPVVDLALNNASAVIAAIEAAAPVDGVTPTAAALKQAHAYFEKRGSSSAKRVVLLVTDGAPNCTLAGELSVRDAFNRQGQRVSGACNDAIQEISGLVKADLPIYVAVLGVGIEKADTNDETANCLDNMAGAGGLAASSPTGELYYSASDPASLQAAIEQLIGAFNQPSCVLPLTQPLDGENNFTVRLNGQAIPRTQSGDGGEGDGWYLGTSDGWPAVILVGQYCDHLKHYEVETFDAIYGCNDPYDAAIAPPVPLL